MPLGNQTAPETSSLEFLHSGNFAMVMATGIISVGLKSFDFDTFAFVFQGIAYMGWLTLITLSIIRVIRYPKAVLADLTSPRMVFSYFTLVAATAIVGMLLYNSGFVLLATTCWAIAFVAWCLLLYTAFSVLTFLSHEDNVNIMHGGWLITIVGTQSLVLLGTLIAPGLGDFTHIMMVEVHMLWGLGLALYGIFVTLFCYRIFFHTLKPGDLSPLLWVVMGAAAISVNAGVSLSWSVDELPFLAEQKPFINGATLMVWSWATWWIPMLFLFGVWKYIINKIPYKYEPAIWSMVFPLGMYAVASQRLGQVAEFPPMTLIAQLMIWIAVGAWVFAIVGMAGSILSLRHNSG